MNNNSESLHQLTPQERLEAYNLITSGCGHLWSKGKMQEEKVKAVLDRLIPLTKNDPYFLAHLTAYAITKTQNKDFQVMTSFANSLSTADGLPFSPGSKYVKPNLRFVSYAAVHKFSPALALRMLLLANNYKFSVDGYLNNATHFSQGLRTAIKKYLKYREANPKALEGIAEAGLNEKVRTMYKVLRIVPDDEVAAIIHYKKKGAVIEYRKRKAQFTGLTDLQVAEKIRAEKITLQSVMTSLDRPLSPVIAVAALEQATGNQAVIFRKSFEDAGILKDKQVMELFQEKLKTAQTAIDRVENMTKTASEEVKKAMKDAKAEVRKKQAGDIGKVFLHIDISSSMSGALEIAKKRGAIIAELVQNPKENFQWGLFNQGGEMLRIPEEFTEDAFRAVLFGRRDSGSTNAFALYPQARQFGADVDVFITDGGHNCGNMANLIRSFHHLNPEVKRPKAAVIVAVGNYYGENEIKRGYEQEGVPVSVIRPEMLTETALVAQSVRTATLGPVAAIDEIMNTPLLQLPEYYFTV